MPMKKVSDLILDDRYQVMPDMSDEDREALTDSIRENGVLVNIEIDENDYVLDGFNRVEICRELGIDEVRVTVKRDMTEDQKLSHARSLNMARRHLTADQRHKLIQDQLRSTPGRSNRQIAKDLGVSDKTVGTQRKKMERRAEIPHTETVTDSMGREQPREKTIRIETEPADDDAGSNAGVDESVKARFEKIEHDFERSVESAVSDITDNPDEEDLNDACRSLSACADTANKYHDELTGRIPAPRDEFDINDEPAGPEENNVTINIFDI